MKIFKALLIVLISFLFLESSMAQKVMKQGYIKMELTDVKTDNAEMSQMIGAMKGSTQEMYFDQGKQKIDINMMGGMMHMQIYQDLKAKTFESYMTMMGQNIKMVMSQEDIEKQNQESAKLMENAKVAYDKNDKKDILGYPCYKATLSIPVQGQTMQMSFYITEKITVPQIYVQNLNNLKLPGAPLAMTIDAGMMAMTYEAKEISEKLDASFFKKPEGEWKEMTPEQLQQMGMGGQMGF